MKYLTFDTILEGWQADTEQDAINWANGIAWCEIETSESEIAYGRYVGSTTAAGNEGVDVYYDFGADYYFFVDTTEGE